MKKYVYLLSVDHKKSVIFFIILNLFLVFAETISLALIPIFIDYVINPSPMLIKYLNPESKLALFLKSEQPIYLSVFFFIMVFLIKNLFSFSVIYYQTHLQKKFNIFIKKKFLNLYIKSPFETIMSYNSSEVLRNIDTEK